MSAAASASTLNRPPRANFLPGIVPGASTRSENDVVGKLSAILWKAEDCSMMIARLADGVIVKGPVDADALPALGGSFRFHGKWTMHEKYGEQFAFTTFTRVVPHDRAGVIAYLVAVADNVGESRAVRLWDAFGAEAVTTLREQPEKVAAAGIMSAEAAKEAATALAEEVKHEATKIDLLGLFAGRGFHSGRLIKECLCRWGAAAPSIIRRNPYLLMLKKLPSAGFRRCDKLYLDLGGDPGRLKRQTLCAAHYLKTNSRGDTWFPARSVGSAITGEVPVGTADPLRALKLGIRAGQLARRREMKADAGPDAPPDVYIAESNKARNEAAIAHKIRELLRAASDN